MKQFIIFGFIGFIFHSAGFALDPSCDCDRPVPAVDSKSTKSKTVVKEETPDQNDKAVPAPKAAKKSKNAR